MYTKTLFRLPISIKNAPLHSQKRTQIRREKQRKRDLPPQKFISKSRAFRKKDPAQP